MTFILVQNEINIYISSPAEISQRTAYQHMWTVVLASQGHVKT